MLIVILLEKFMASAFRVINEFAKKIYIYIFFLVEAGWEFMYGVIILHVLMLFLKNIYCSYERFN